MKDLIKSIFEITITKVIITFLGSIFLVSQVYFVNNEEALEDDYDIEQEVVIEKTKKNNPAPKRTPSSITAERSSNKKVQPLDIQPEILNRNEDNYNPISSSPVDSRPERKNNQRSHTHEESTNSHYSTNLADNSIESEITTPPKDGRSNRSNNNENQTFLGAPTKETANITPENKSGLKNPPETTSSSPEDLHCFSDVLSGTMGNPISVNLNCNYLSNIKYCLSKDTCCDPRNAGTQYTSSLTIGSVSGNYCLSYYGESEIGGFSEVLQNNYNINNNFPHLVTGSHRSYYQTTELVGETFLTSNDFGKANFFAGQTNFKSNDPTALGLNYSCEEIVENDHTSLSPVPSTTLSLFDISTLLPVQEIKIPFREDKLDYGINYLSSFLKNNSHVVPLYSCSTILITLEDFNYFESSISQASIGDNDVREFEAQFTSFGFFEDDANVYRGPAGESINEKSGTFLESGLLSIFY